MNVLQCIDRAKAVCFTGHRPGRLTQDAGGLRRLRGQLQDKIEDAVKRGKCFFINGGMAGFDIFAAEQVLYLKERYPDIQCAVIAPFSVHYYANENWTQEWRQRATTVFQQSDFKISLSEHYRKSIYYERDRALVDSASEVIAYYDGGAGGTKYTVQYARGQGLPVINLYGV